MNTKPITRHITEGNHEITDVIEEEYRSLVRVAEILHRLGSSIKIETPMGDFLFYHHDGTDKSEK